MLSCKKKPDDEPATVGPCETKYEVLYGESVSTNETASVSYENGQIKSINSNSLQLTYEYASDRVIISNSGTPVYRIDIADKLATRITDLKD